MSHSHVSAATNLLHSRLLSKSSASSTSRSSKHTTTETLLFQLTNKNKENNTLKQNVSTNQEEQQQLLDVNQKLTAQLSLAHRQLGTMAEETRQLRQDTETSKILHTKKAEIAERRVVKLYKEKLKTLQEETNTSNSSYTTTVQDIQQHWNEARHQLAFEREIVATQFAKITLLEKTLEQNDLCIQAERNDYEKKCQSLTNIHDEQRASLVEIQQQFQQCRTLVANEQHCNIENVTKLQQLEKLINEKDQLLKKGKVRTIDNPTLFQKREKETFISFFLCVSIHLTLSDAGAM